MRLVRGSSRYAIGAPSRSTTPCRLGLTILMAGPPAIPAPGVSERVGLKRLRVAITLYACAGSRGDPAADGGAAGVAAAGREREGAVGRDPMSCFTMRLTQSSDTPASSTLTASRRLGIQLLAWPCAAGRRNPETVSVTSRSFGCVKLTTDLLVTLTVDRKSTRL